MCSSDLPPLEKHLRRLLPPAGSGGHRFNLRGGLSVLALAKKFLRPEEMFLGFRLFGQGRGWNDLEKKQDQYGKDVSADSQERPAGRPSNTVERAV